MDQNLKRSNNKQFARGKDVNAQLVDLQNQMSGLNRKIEILDQKNSWLEAQLLESSLTSRSNLGHIDFVHSFTPHSQIFSPIILSTSGTIIIQGWAVDPSSKSVLDSVFISVNGKSYKADYGIHRPDVARYLNSSTCNHCGFACILPIRDLPIGRHWITIKGVANGGKYYSFTQRALFELQTSTLRLRYLFSPAAVLFFLLIGINPWTLVKMVSLIKSIGLRLFLRSCREGSWSIKSFHVLYKKKILEKQQTDNLVKQRKTRFKYEPKISIVVPTFNTPPKMLLALLDSVLNQTYANWELCFADGTNEKYSNVRNILQKYANRYSKIKLRFLSENKGIAGNSNEAIALATGEFVALLDHDDLLPLDALFHVVDAINRNPQADFFYSDENKVSKNGEEYSEILYKPDFSSDMLRSYNYIAHFLVIKKSLGDACGWFRSGFDGSQDYDLVLRASEKAYQIVHIPRILYHWRIHSNSTAGNQDAKSYAHTTGKKCLQEHLQRIGLKGEVVDSGWNFIYKIEHHFLIKPLVSIIIPNKNQAKILERCIDSIMRKTTYENFEILIVENMSLDKKIFTLYESFQKYENVRIIEWKYPFNFSKLNNFAVKEARGEVILFLNNDTEIISADWIESMLQHALRPDVGVVGAKLYYPDGTIQHGGVIIGVGGVAGHAHRYFSGVHEGYFNRLRIVQNLSAVTAACLMMRKNVFEEIGGFDETLAVAFNDVDLCLKVRNKNYLIVWTPYAELYHHESISRGYDDDPVKKKRFLSEVELMKSRWKSVLEKGDPYYNPNLTLVKEDFSFKN